MRDMVRKGRHVVTPAFLSAERLRGEDNAAAVLTEDAVRDIRQRYTGRGRGISQQALADEYGVNQTLISAIVRRKIWQHVE